MSHRAFFSYTQWLVGVSLTAEQQHILFLDICYTNSYTKENHNWLQLEKTFTAFQSYNNYATAGTQASFNRLYPKVKTVVLIPYSCLVNIIFNMLIYVNNGNLYFADVPYHYLVFRLFSSGIIKI